MINSFTTRPQLRLRTVFFSLWFAGAAGFLAPVPSLAVDDGPSSSSIIVFPLRITTPSSLPPATVGAFYNFQLSAAGGTPPYSWALAPLAGLGLPRGLALSASGSLSGTPVTNGIFGFAGQVSDSGRRQTETNFFLIISNANEIPPGIDEFGLVKHQDYVQNSSSPPILAANNPFVFFGFIRLSTPGAVAGASLQRPDGSTRLLKVENAGKEFYFEERFATKAALDLNYPNGTYVLSVNTANGPRSLRPLTWFGDAYPQAPRLNNFEAAQSFNPRTDFILSWDPFPGGTLDDFAELAIFSNTGEQLYGSGEFLNGTSTGFVIPANTLQAGQTYFGSLAIAKIVSTNKPGVPASSSPGVSGHQSETRFPLLLSLPTGSIAVKTAGLPSGQVNQGYAFDLEAFGGTAPYAWSITPNSLPPGLAFDPATGKITGVPFSPGSFSLNVRVTDTLGQSAETSLPLFIAPAQAGFSILNFSEASASAGAAFDGKNFLISFKTLLPDGRSALGAQLLSPRGTAVGAPIMVDRVGDAPLVAFDGANYLLVWADHALGLSVPVFGQFLTPSGEKAGPSFQISQSGAMDRPDGLAFDGSNYLVIWTRQKSASEGAGAPNVFGRFVSKTGTVLGNDFQISGTSGKFGSIGFDGTNFLVIWTDEVSNQLRGRFVNGLGLSGLEFSISARTSAVIESRSALAFDGRNYLVVWNDESLLAGATQSQDLYGQIISKDGTLVESTIRINSGRGGQLRPFLAFDGFNHLITWTDARNDSNGNFICEPGEGSCLDILGQFVSRSGKLLGPVFPVAADPGNQTESPLVYGAGKYFAAWTSSGVTAREQPQFGDSQLRGTFINPLGPVTAPTLPARTVAVGSDMTLSVDVSGQEPLFYQWQFQGTNLPGQTNATLALSNIQASVAGFYTLVVSNLAGVSSTTISVVALDPPVIISQPGSQTSSAGANLTLQVFAAGTLPLRYRWRFNGVNIPDATNSTLVLANLQSSNSGLYSVVVANPVAATSSQPARLKVSSGPVLPPLLFDNFNNRFTTNTPAGGTVIGDNTGATQEPGEPTHDRKRGGKSVWFSWIAPGGGTARFNTKGSSLDTVLAVYTGTSVADLTRVTSDDDQGDFFTSAVTFKARDGVAYHLAIDGRGGAEGDINLNWEFEFGVEDIPQIVTQPRGQTVDLGADVQLTASIAVADEINTRPVLAYQWFLNGQPVPGANNTNLTITNLQPAQVGTYRLAVAHTAIGKSFLSDPATLEIGSTTATATSADKFEDILAELAENPPLQQSFRRKKAYASVSAGSIGTQTMDNFGSTTEPGEPNHGGVIGGASRWFTLVPQTNGIMILDTIGSDIDTVLAVYRGNNLFNLTVVASDDNGAPDGVRSLAKFTARKGTNYLVAVDGVNGAQGNIRLNWKLGIAPTISQQPTNQNVPMGGAISLAVSATAIPSPAYQWRLNGVDLFGATNSVLILENFQEGNQGNYNVVASNFAGTVSAAAVLSLSLPQQLSGLTTNGLFTLQLTAQPAQTYVIQASSNLIDWTSIFTNTPQNGSFTFADAESATLLWRFYRSFLLSIP